MSEDTQITEREPLQPAAAEGDTRKPANGPAVLPLVDIVEDAGGITVYADLPGVSREQLDIRVHGDTLFLEGRAVVEVAAGIKLLHAEVREATYRRSFTLSNELDKSAIDASLSNGVLTLRIPRTEQARPRRIAVKTA